MNMQIHNGTPSSSSSISFHSILGFSSEFSDGCKHAHTHSRNNIKKKHKSLHEGKISIVNRKSNQCYIDGEKSVWAPRGELKIILKLKHVFELCTMNVSWFCIPFQLKDEKKTNRCWLYLLVFGLESVYFHLVDSILCNSPLYST